MDSDNVTCQLVNFHEMIASQHIPGKGRGAISTKASDVGSEVWDLVERPNVDAERGEYDEQYLNSNQVVVFEGEDSGTNFDMFDDVLC